MKITSTNKKFAALALIVTFFAFCGIMLHFDNTIRKSIEAEAYTALKNSAESGAYYIHHHLNDLINSSALTASIIGAHSDIHIRDIFTMLRDNLQLDQNTRYMLIDLKGKAWTTDRLQMNVADRTFFKTAVRGTPGITFEPLSQIDGSRTVVIATPITKAGKVIGVFTKNYGERNLKYIFDAPSYDKKGSFFIVDRDGTVIQQPQNMKAGTFNAHSNIFETAESEECDRSLTKDAMRADLLAGKSGYFKYTYKGDTRLMYYTPLKVNGWYMLAFVPYSSLVQRFFGFTKAGISIMGLTALFFLLLIIGVIYLFKNNMKEIEKSKRSLEAVTRNVPGGVAVCETDEGITFVTISRGYLELLGCADEKELQTKYGRKTVNTIYKEDREAVLANARQMLAEQGYFEVEHRIARDDGRLLWVQVTGRIVREEGHDYYYSLISDITRARQTQEALSVSEERYRVVMESTEDYIFDWDIKKDTLFSSPKYVETYGQFSLYGSVCAKHSPEAKVHKEDIPALNRFVSALRKGKQEEDSIELRLRTLKGKYTWCRVQAHVIYDKDGTLTRIVGIVKNIDDSVKEREKLRLLAETDALSGLYSKAAAEGKITAYLENEAKSLPCALFTLDIDNFKSINDNYGHLYGDIVISEVGARLRNCFSDLDITGRVGGDEFMVLMKNADAEAARGKIEEIVHTFSLNSLQAAQGEKAPCVTCSIGVALYPQDARDFLTLYEKADSALYEAKMAGRNRGCLYNHNTTHSAAERAHKTAFDSPDILTARAAFRDNLCEYVLRMLYTAKDPKAALQLCVGMVGRYFDAGRCYIIEFDREANTAWMSCEWCRPDVARIAGNYQKTAIADYMNPEERFAESEIFCLRSTNELKNQSYAQKLRKEGVTQMIQCAFRERGLITGVLGFDECGRQSRAALSEAEQETMKLVSGLLSAFIAKEQAQERAEEKTEILNTFIENTGQLVYAVDTETLQLIWCCSALRELAPEARPGASCHEALRHSKEPCSDCPFTGGAAETEPRAEREAWITLCGISCRLSAIRLPQHKDGRKRGLIWLRKSSEG